MDTATNSPADPRRWALLSTVATGLLLVTLDNTILYTALPTLTQALGASADQALWIINAYPLVMAGLLLGSGTLGDRIGHRKTFIAGLLVFGAASLQAAFAPTAGWLIFARALLAVGAAAMMPATLALIGLTFRDPRERHFAIAVWGSIALIGAALGPVIGGLLLARFWWGSVFLINVPIVILALIGAFAFAPVGRPDPNRPWDLPSSLLALVSLAAAVFALKAVIAPTPSWLTAGSSGAVALLAGAWFVRRQARLPYPLLDFAVFRNPTFSSGALAAVFTLFALAGLQLVMTQRYQLVLGYTPLQAGLLVSAVALGCLPSALLGGAWLHRIGLRPLMAGGLGVAAIGILVTTLATPHGLIGVLVGLSITGLGLGATISVASSAIIGSVPAHRVGMASSVEEVSYEFGGLLAVALLGSLSSLLYSRGVATLPDLPAAARDSLAQALPLLADAGAGAGAWRGVAFAAFDDSYRVVLVLIAASLALAALLTARLLAGGAPLDSTEALHT